MTLTITNDLVNGTTSDATKVQQNFDDIETWAAAIIAASGAVAMTGDLTLKAASPTADNHAARKKYVDDECNSHQAAAEATAAADATTKADAAQTAATTAAQTELLRVVDAAPAIPALTTAFQALGLSVTVDPVKTTGLTIVTATVDASCSATGGDLVVQLKKGGVAVADQLIWTPNAAGSRQTVTRTWYFASTGASVVYDLEAKKTGGTYVIAGAPHTDLEAVNIA